VVVRHGAIRALGPAREILPGFKGLICDHGEGAILPGLVNCHAHLEFSALAGRIAPQERWEEWLDTALAQRESLAPEEVERASPGIKALPQRHSLRARSATPALLPIGNSPWITTCSTNVGFHSGAVDLAKSFRFWETGAGQPASAAPMPLIPSPVLFQAISWNGALPQTVHLGESRSE
jgi:hypothetical protein